MVSYTEWHQRIKLERWNWEFEQTRDAREVLNNWSFDSSLDWDTEEAINPSLVCHPTSEFRYRGAVAALNKKCIDCDERAVVWYNFGCDQGCCNDEYFFCHTHFAEFWGWDE